MRCAAALALLLCAGQVTALPVNSPMDKGDTEVMRCIVEVISDTLSKPSPMPISPECLETLRGDERILSILRHQNLLKELQDLALRGAQERTQQHKKHRSFGEQLSEVLENQSGEATSPEVTEEPSSKEAAEKRRDATEGTRPQALPEPGQGHSQAPGEEEAPSTQPPASPAGQRHPGPQAVGDSEGPAQGLVDREKGPRAEQGQQTNRQQEEEEAEAAEKAAPEEEGPTTASDPPLSLSYKDSQKDESPSESLGVDGAPKPEAEETRPPEGRGARVQPRRQQEEEEDLAGTPQGLIRGGKSGEQEPERRLSREWEEATRWSKMDQLARELTAGRRLEGEDEEDDPDPDRSMKLSFRARAFGPRGPGLQLRRGWRPSSREDLPLQARGYPEEKKEEEGSANRRAEDQELESLSAIEAELEKVAHQLQALRRG